MPITIDGSGNITGLVAGGLPDLSVTNADLATNAVSTSKLLDSAVTTAKLGSNEQAGLAKAWVNFNGTTASPSTIRASYNVSSVTKNGTGDYTVNFTTALADANYVGIGMSRFDTGSGVSNAFVNQKRNGVQSSSAFDISAQNTVATSVDVDRVFVAIFR